MSERGFTVEAYSGHRHGERPRAFTWQGHRYEVLSVERSWRTPHGLGFVVRAVRAVEAGAGPVTNTDRPSGRRWELAYNEVRDTWHIRCVDIERDRLG